MNQAYLPSSSHCESQSHMGSALFGFAVPLKLPRRDSGRHQESRMREKARGILRTGHAGPRSRLAGVRGCGGASNDPSIDLGGGGLAGSNPGKAPTLGFTRWRRNPQRNI